MSNKGWECPKCGRVYAPFVQSCSSCNESEKITLPYSTMPPLNSDWKAESAMRRTFKGMLRKQVSDE